VNGGKNSDYSDFEQEEVEKILIGLIEHKFYGVHTKAVYSEDLKLLTLHLYDEPCETMIHMKFHRDDFSLEKFEDILKRISRGK
jgi:hypothetical protein